MAEAVQVSRRPRRLIAACDGTWNSTDRQTHTTNVVRLARSIRSCTSDGISQIVYYHTGVGTGNVLDHWLGGGVGVGLSQIVRSVYAWFVDNYQDGDEIFLFGFSRGAYTARSVAGLMAHVGLLRKRDMENFNEVWAYYRLPTAIRDKEELEFLANFSDRIPRDQLRIKCIGVWDTVGSLGIPGSRFCQKDYAFHNAVLGPGVECAYQALAIDEHRKPFAPSVWTSNPSPRVDQVVEQVWFSGAHSNIGGGYAEHVLSDATLFWMASRVAPLLGLDCEYLCAQADRLPPYAMGRLVNSLSWFYRLLWGRYVRPICQTDPSEGIHESVFLRLNAPAGVPIPSPYGDLQLRKTLAGSNDKMISLAPFEKNCWPPYRQPSPSISFPTSTIGRCFETS